MSEQKVWRTIQPAHHSDRITVAQAKAAFLKVEAERAEKRRQSRAKKREAATADGAEPS